MFKIVTADERLAKPPKSSIVIAGASGIGKTTLARTLDPETTLFVDLEAGTLALGDWPGDILEIRKMSGDLGVHPWALARAVACVMAGPDPAATDPANPYSREAYDAYCTALGGKEVFDRYQTVFWDSITVAARHSFAWSQTQPDAFSDKTGKPDNRGAYGLHGREMIRWLTTIQHIPNKSTVVVGILNAETDDLRRTTYSLQIDGNKAKDELPGIFDNVFTLASFTTEPTDGTAPIQYRALVCQNLNQWGYPAKDRSGRLDLLEPPDLAYIIKKTKAPNRTDVLVTTLPGASEAA